MEIYEFPKSAIGLTYLLTPERFQYLKSKGFIQHEDYPFLFAHNKLDSNLWFDLREKAINGYEEFNVCFAYYSIGNNQFYKLGDLLDLINICEIDI